LRAGKLSGEQLERMVLSTIQFRRDDVLVHAGLGEDSAVIDFGDEVCLISTDPITGAVQGIGELAVHVSCNDIAANGGTPIGVQIMLLLPESIEEAQIVTIMEDIQRTAASLGVEVIGGHTEITSRVTECVLSVTAVGRAPRERYVTSHGAQVGDDILITKGVGIEATAIIARDFAEHLPFTVHPEEVAEFTRQLSVVPEGLLAAEFGVSAMHDITEGGLLGAIGEICYASKTGCEIWESAVYIPELTRRITGHLQLDALALLSSGSMLIVASRGQELRTVLQEQGIPSYIVGRITEGLSRIVIRENGKREDIPSYVQDELWRLFARFESS
jgi:hydrogenase expression/formation protein HypE